MSDLQKLLGEGPSGPYRAVAGQGTLKQVKKYQKRIYAKACLACRARKVKCLNPETPPCAQCKQGGFVCEVPDGPRAGTGQGGPGGSDASDGPGKSRIKVNDGREGSVGASEHQSGRAVKRSRTSSAAPVGDVYDGLTGAAGASGRQYARARGQGLSLEARVMRIEAYLRLDSDNAGYRLDELHHTHSQEAHSPPHAAHQDPHGSGPHLEPEHPSDASYLSVAEEEAGSSSATPLRSSSRLGLPSRTSHLRLKKEHLDHPRYSLGPVGQVTYHGETSFLDDFSGNGGAGDIARAGTPTTAIASGFTRPHPLEQRSDLPSSSHSHNVPAGAAPNGRPLSTTSPFAMLQKGQEEEELAQEDRMRSARRARHRYATPEEGEAYIQAHFCWASQTYGVISHPLLLRDMATGGPYCSQLLLLVLYLSGIRFTTSLNEAEREAKSERYFEILMGLLMVEMRRPTKITTIQALLALAGRQCAVGRSNEGWLYTGMAIRMMQDMGIHLPLDETNSSRFSAEEREMRTRLYWSAYNWDKTLALTLGREPALILRSGHSPDKITDESHDSTLWIPSFNGVATPVPDYPPFAANTVRILRHSSRLNMILESILLNMYSPERPNARSLSFVRSAHERLDEFWQSLPRDLRLEKGNMPAVCPPSNGILLNLLYQVQFILLYRPLLSSQHQSPAVAATALEVCRGAATTAHEIFTMWGRTFGFVNMVYLMMYCCFVCAGVDVILLRVGNDGIKQEALGRVLLGLEILEAASSQGPGIRQGIATIRSQLERATRGDFAVPAPSIAVAPGLTANGNPAMRSLSLTTLPQVPMPSLSFDNVAPRSLLHRRTVQQSNVRAGDSANTFADPLARLNGAMAETLVPSTAFNAPSTAENASTATVGANGTSQIGQAAGDTGAIDPALIDFGPDGDFSSWFDSVNLVDLLGELPVSSEDPFGFGTDWGGWQT